MAKKYCATIVFHDGDIIEVDGFVKARTFAESIISFLGDDDHLKALVPVSTIKCIVVNEREE